jgi:hypothetical protein
MLRESILVVAILALPTYALAQVQSGAPQTGVQSGAPQTGVQSGAPQSGLQSGAPQSGAGGGTQSGAGGGAIGPQIPGAPPAAR